MSPEPIRPVIPAWASNKQQTLELRKRNVLRFLFLYACLHLENGMTMRKLGVQLGLTETAINASIGLGTISENIAYGVEKLVGPKTFSAEWLLDPLSLLK